MNPELAHKFYKNNIYKEKFNIQTAHNTSFHDEVITIPIFKIFNKNENHKFYLFKFSEKYHGLIGVDLLKQLNANINVTTKLITTPHASIPIIFGPEETKNNSNNISNYSLIIPPRAEKIVKIPVNHENGIGILNYTNFGEGIEMPKALVNISNHFATTTLININENPVKLDIHQPIEIEIVDPVEINCIQEMETNNVLDKHQDNQLKQNLKNLRLDHCNKEEKEAIRDLCFEYRDIIYCENIPLSFTNQITHEIKLKDDSPIYTKSYRYPEIHKEEVRTQISNMLKQGIIQNSVSPWSSPIWIVPKKMDASGRKKWRLVIDYRKLNERTIDDKYPLPNITDILDKLGRANYFTTLDLASGFHQIEVNPNDVQKTAFSTEGGHYEYRRMPFGLKNAPATFQRVMDNVLRGLQHESCLVYLDDIIIFSTSLDEHIIRLRSIFDRLRKSNFKIQLDKSEFLQKSVQYLGHIITPNGVKPNPEKIMAIKKFPIPRTQKEIKSFLGLLGYYRRFIRDFAKLTKPMTKCLKKDSKIIHNKEFINCFRTCQNILTNDPILQYPDFKKPFILTTDASNFALGAVLSQGEISRDKPIAYASRTLNETETRYSTIEKELLAIVWACKHFRPYLYGRKFTIYTDHRPLTWLFNLKEPNSKLVRWRLKLEEYDYNIVYKKGKINTNADALSRIPINALEEESLINHPGDADKDILDFLKTLSENPFEEEADDPQPSTSTDPKPAKQKIKIIQDIQIRPPDNDSEGTPHSQNEETINEAIPILDEIINNKSHQILVKPNVHNKIEVLNKDYKNLKILEIKIPKTNEKLVLNFLREYTTSKFTFYLYFFDKKLYKTFNKIYMQHFYGKGLKLINCTKLINTVREIDEQIMLIKYQHEGKCNHRGITETLEKLKRNYYWPGMKSDVTNYINNCNSCQVAKYSRNPPYVPLVITETSSKPFEILHIDTFKFNNQIYLTILDKFSKLGQAIQTKSTTAIETCNALLKFFTFYGLPTKIIMDNGSEFNNATVKELLKLHKIEIHFTTPMHHESNSPVERFHSTLIEHLRLLRNEHGDDPNLMKYAIIAYNNSIHSTTNFTPYELVLGHTNSRDPSELINKSFYSDYVSNHHEKLKALYKDVTQKSKEIKTKIIEKINTQGPNQYHFKLNQIVYKASDRRNKKENKFRGPFKLIEFLQNNKVKIQNSKNNKTEIIHIKELKRPSVVTDLSSASSTSSQE